MHLSKETRDAPATNGAAREDKRDHVTVADLNEATKRGSTLEATEAAARPNRNNTIPMRVPTDTSGWISARTRERNRERHSRHSRRNRRSQNVANALPFGGVSLAGYSHDFQIVVAIS